MYSGSGKVKYDLDDNSGAIADFTEAINLNPDRAELYFARGITFCLKDDNQSASKDLLEATKLKPDDGSYRSSLVRVMKSLGDTKEAEEQEKIARSLMEKENEYNRSCFEAICGNKDKALELLKVGLEKNQSTKEWAHQDPDFEAIRNDPRFKELVGE